MATKYLEKSAAVINEAQRYERQLAWQMFAEDQETQLWSMRKDINWVPGKPLYKDPRTIPWWTDDGPEFNEWSGSWGNTVRPMVQLRDDRLELTDCQTCEVSGAWKDTSCWFCGEDYARVARDERMVKNSLLAYGSIYFGVQEASVYVYDRALMPEELLENALLTFRGYTVRDVEVSHSLYGLRASMSFVDEVFSWGHHIREWEANFTPREEPQREITIIPDWYYAPFSWVEPSPMAWITGGLDLDAQPTIPLPVMPEPIDFPDYRETYWRQLNSRYSRSR